MEKIVSSTSNSCLETVSFGRLIMSKLDFLHKLNEKSNTIKLHNSNRLKPNYSELKWAIPWKKVRSQIYSRWTAWTKWSDKPAKLEQTDPSLCAHAKNKTHVTESNLEEHKMEIQIPVGVQALLRRFASSWRKTERIWLDWIVPEQFVPTTEFPDENEHNKRISPFDFSL